MIHLVPWEVLSKNNNIKAVKLEEIRAAFYSHKQLESRLYSIGGNKINNLAGLGVDLYSH